MTIRQPRRSGFYGLEPVFPLPPLQALRLFPCLFSFFSSVGLSDSPKSLFFPIAPPSAFFCSSGPTPQPFSTFLFLYVSLHSFFSSSTNPSHVFCFFHSSAFIHNRTWVRIPRLTANNNNKCFLR